TLLGGLDLNGKSLTISGTMTNNGLLQLQGGETTLFTNDTAEGETRYNGKRAYSSLLLGNTYSDLSFYGSGSFMPTLAITATNVSVSGATLDLRGKTATISSTLTNSGTILIRGGETVTYGTSTMPGGTAIYSGTGTFSSLLLGNTYKN